MDRATLFTIFMAVAFAFSSTYSFFAQGNLQLINSALQQSNLEQGIIITKQGILLMAFEFQGKTEWANSTIIEESFFDLKNNTKFFSDNIETRTKRIQKLIKGYTSDSYISLGFLFLGLIFLVIAIWSKKTKDRR